MLKGFEQEYASYYPYGLRITAASVMLSGGSSTNEDLYNGKTLTGAFGLSWYHYGARFYDVATARWTTMDPAWGILFTICVGQASIPQRCHTS